MPPPALPHEKRRLGLPAGTVTNPVADAANTAQGAVTGVAGNVQSEVGSGLNSAANAVRDALLG